MNSHGRAFELMRERERLLMRCDAQRLDLAETIGQLQGPLKVADRTIEGVDYLRRHPLVLGAGLVLLMLIRPRASLGLAQRGFILWRAYRALRGFIAA